MTKQNSINLQAVCIVGLFLIIHIITYNPFFSLKILNAVPVPMISAVVMVAYYFDEWWAFIAGVLSGLFADAVTGGTMCLNAVFLLILGLISGILLKRYFNRNILSACTISFTGSAIYFLLHGLFFSFNNDVFQALQYLLLHSLPSAIYSGFFIIPFFFLGKLIKKI